MKTLKMNERNGSLDAIKAIACFLIVFLHCSLDTNLYPASEYVCAFARVAVPLFIMITGYYFLSIVEKGRMKKFMFKIVRITLVGSCFYLLVALYLFDVQTIFNFENLKNWLLFNSVPVTGFHLWYLYALIYILLVVYYGMSFFSSGKNAFALAIFLLFCNYLLSFCEDALYVRNFLMLGLPYFLLGFCVKKYEQRIMESSFWKGKHYLIFLFMLLLQVAEFYFYKKMGVSLPREHFLMTTPLSCYLFVVAIKYPKLNKCGFLAYIGDKLSTNIYIYHVFIILLSDRIVMRLLRTNVISAFPRNYLYPVLMMVITTTVVFCFKKIKLKGRR